MADFPSAKSYFEFASSVRWQWRFTRDSVQTAFLDAVLASSVQKRVTLPAGTLLYRAQLGCEWPTNEEEESDDAGPQGFSPERMKPMKSRASEGRVNPQGMPCLYAATIAETAAAEVRPWIGAYISVAQLRTRRALTVVNCTSADQQHVIYFEEPEAPEREVAVWRDIDRAFAEPVERDEHSAAYVPTQVIAEAFREQGMDGIGYRSSLGAGLNIALFDLDVADVINCTVHYARSIHFDLPEVANPYFVAKHYPAMRHERLADP